MRLLAAASQLNKRRDATARPSNLRGVVSSTHQVQKGPSDRFTVRGFSPKACSRLGVRLCANSPITAAA